MWLRQSTASQEIKLGTFLDETDFNTPEPGLTIANTDIKITKGGATTEVDKNSGGATHVASGRYSAVLDATDTDTLGIIEIDVHVAGALAVHRTYMILPAVIYDTMVLATDNMPANILAISDDAIAADNLELMYDGTGYLADSAPSSRSQVDNIGAASGGAFAIEATEDNESTPIKGISSVGVETGTFVNTEANDGVYHVITHVANDIDWIYGFDVGGSRTAVSVDFRGFLNSNNDAMFLQAFDFVGSDWDTIRPLPGQNGSTDVPLVPSLLSKHTGTGSDLGKVYLRFVADGVMTSPVLNVDLLHVLAVNIGQSIGYSEGAIWVDTINGVAGVEPFVNGVADNPVLTWADALTLSANIGVERFRIINGSTITLSSDSTNFTIDGENYTLALGGQSISGIAIIGSNGVTGTGTDGGAMPRFMDCLLGSVNLPSCELLRCCLSADFVATSAGAFHFIRCHSLVAGVGTPSFDFGASNLDQDVNFRGYSGGIEIKNMGQSGTDNLSLEGHGQYILNVNCSGGTMRVAGHFDKTDNSGAVTLVETARYDEAQISKASGVIRNAIAQGSGTGSNQIQLDSSASATDGAYDPALVVIVAGTGLGQTRLILEYNGTTKTATVDRNWKINPDATSEFNIVANAGRNHVNEGLALAATASTITLNALASSVDDVYIGQIVFIRSGKGEDQAGTVIDYNGTTKIATIDKVWGIIPDTTSGYTMIPASPVILAGTTHTGAIIPTVQTCTTNTDMLTTADILASGDVDGFSIEEALKLLLSASAGVLSGADTNTVVIKAADGSKTRLTATVDALGNRIVVVKDATG